MFDKFEQIENSLSREVGGSGLGLSIAKQLITAHNGAIWCDSIINKGSSFYFVLPIANDINRFALSKKSLIQEAKKQNSSLTILTVKSNKEEISNILNEETIWNEHPKSDAFIESNHNNTIVKIAIINSDIKAGRVIGDKINSIIALHKEKYQNCDIMYSYEVEEVSDEKSSYC